MEDLAMLSYPVTGSICCLPYVQTVAPEQPKYPCSLTWGLVRYTDQWRVCSRLSFKAICFRLHTLNTRMIERWMTRTITLTWFSKNYARPFKKWDALCIHPVWRVGDNLRTTWHTIMKLSVLTDLIEGEVYN